MKKGNALIFIGGIGIGHCLTIDPKATLGLLFMVGLAGMYGIMADRAECSAVRRRTLELRDQQLERESWQRNQG
jgi:hypothetical protein